MTSAPNARFMSHAGSTGNDSKLSLFARTANGVARITGKPATFAVCCLLIVVWGATGPLFHYSDTWQLIINTGTTIITFLMVLSTSRIRRTGKARPCRPSWTSSFGQPGARAMNSSRWSDCRKRKCRKCGTVLHARRRGED